MEAQSQYRLICKTGLRQIRDCARVGDTMFVGGERKGRYSDPILDHAGTPVPDGAALWSYDLTAGLGGDAVAVEACDIEDVNCFYTIGDTLYVGGWKGEWSYLVPEQVGFQYREAYWHTLRKGCLWVMAADGSWSEIDLTGGIPDGWTDKQIVLGQDCTRLDEIIGLIYWDNALWISTSTGAYRLSHDGGIDGVDWSGPHVPMDTQSGTLCSIQRGSVTWREWKRLSADGRVGYWVVHNFDNGWVCRKRNALGWSEPIPATNDEDSPPHLVRHAAATRRIQGELCAVQSIRGSLWADRIWADTDTPYYWSWELEYAWRGSYYSSQGDHLNPAVWQPGHWQKRVTDLELADYSAGCNVWRVPDEVGLPQKLTGYPIKPSLGLVLEPWVSERCGERLWIAEGYPALGANNAIIHVWPWDGAQRTVPTPSADVLPPAHTATFNSAAFNGYVNGVPSFSTFTITNHTDCWKISSLSRSRGRLYAGIVDRLHQDVLPLADALANVWQNGVYRAEYGSGLGDLYCYVPYAPASGGRYSVVQVPTDLPVWTVDTDDTAAWLYSVSTACFRALVSHDSRWCALSGSDGWTFEWWPSGRLQERDEVAGPILSAVSHGGTLFLGRSGAVDRGTSSVGPWETDAFTGRACESLAIHGNAPHGALVGATDTLVSRWSSDTWNDVATLSGAYSVLCEHGTTLWAFGEGPSAYIFNASHPSGQQVDVTELALGESVLCASSDGTYLWVGTDLGAVLRYDGSAWTTVYEATKRVTALLYWHERLWIGCTDGNGVVAQLVNVAMPAGYSLYAVGDEGDRTVLALTTGTGAVETFSLGETDEAIAMLDTYGSDRIIYSRSLTSRSQSTKGQWVPGQFGGRRWVEGYDAAFWPDSQPSEEMMRLFPWLTCGAGEIVLGWHWERNYLSITKVYDGTSAEGFWIDASDEDEAYGRGYSMIYPTWARPSAICVRADTHPLPDGVDLWVTFHPTSLDLKDWQPVEAGLYTSVVNNSMRNLSLTYRVAMRLAEGVEEPSFASKLKVEVD